MKAMILAAGLGTRLRPLTDDRPKALVELAGRTLLEITITRLRAAGVTEIIVNTHHFADGMQAYLRSHDNFGMRVEISQEDLLLDTGGGLKKTADFFLETPDEHFILHNVDVLTDIDLGAMLRFHTEHDALATLAVQKRMTSRHLLFDESGQLCGRRAGLDGTPEMVLPFAPQDLAPQEPPTNGHAPRDLAPQARAFSGVHVLSPHIFAKMQESGVFSIITSYLRLAAAGERILAFPADAYYWRDLGRPEHLQAAEQDLASGATQLPR